MSTVDALRKQARKVETDLDLKLVQYSRLDGGDEGSSSSAPKRPEKSSAVLQREIEQLLLAADGREERAQHRHRGGELRQRDVGDREHLHRGRRLRRRRRQHIGRRAPERDHPLGRALHGYYGT